MNVKIALPATLALMAGISALMLTTVESKIRAAAVVNSGFKDTETLQFRSLRKGSDGAERYICGEVNGKNSYGAYAGFEPFVVWPDRGADGEFQMLNVKPLLMRLTIQEETLARCQLSASVASWSLIAR